MQEGMDKFIPKQSAGYVTNKRLWITHRAFKAKSKKYFYWKKFQESKLHAHYETYKKYENRAVAEIRKAKKSFEKKPSVNIKSNPKSFYAYVRSKSKTKTKVGPLIDSQNMQVEEEEQMCEILNKYFSSVFTFKRPEGLMKLENRLNHEKVASKLNKVLITEE